MRLLPPIDVGDRVQAAGLPTWVTRLAEAEIARAVHVTVDNAAMMSDEKFESAVRAAYVEIFASIDREQPVRFWNCVPDIDRAGDNGRDRYQFFNAGRFAAFESYYGGVENFPRSVATASAVGHAGQDFTVHCLTMHRPGEPVDNPAQIRPDQYSRRFGPRPPCFARGTLIRTAGGTTLLAGGTASIRGETSMHAGDLQQQMLVTLQNLAGLVRAAGIKIARPLESFTELRVYHPIAEHRRQLSEAIDTAFPNVGHVEFVNAAICRHELLVEIEGVAGDRIA